MEKPALIEFLKELCNFFERKVVPHQSTVDLWFEQVGFIPAESLPWIKAKIFENETFPRNLSNAMQSLYRDWLAGHPDKRMSEPTVGCENCASGFLTVWYQDENLSRPYSHTFRCAYCNSDGFPKAMPAVIAKKLSLSGKYFYHPKDVKFNYHDFFPGSGGAVKEYRDVLLCETMNVIINKWIGEGFELPNCICWTCGKPATVVEMADRNGALMARICKTCLNLAMEAISEEILKYHREKCSTVKGCSCGG